MHLLNVQSKSAIYDLYMSLDCLSDNTELLSNHVSPLMLLYSTFTIPSLEVYDNGST